MSQAKFKYLVHPLLGKPENRLPREIYSAFLAAQVEIDHVCKCLDNIKLTMDDLKKACDESSKETKPESVYGTFIRRLLYANTVSEMVIEKKIGSTLLRTRPRWYSTGLFLFIIILLLNEWNQPPT